MQTGCHLGCHDILLAMFRSFFRKSGRQGMNLDNVQAVFFDLDGTLVDVDMELFVGGYLRRLTERMGDRAEPARAARVLHQAVAAMFANSDADKTLEQILYEVLQVELSMPAEEYQASLEQFCRQDLD